MRGRERVADLEQDVQGTRDLQGALEVEDFIEADLTSVELDALVRTVQETFDNYARLSRRLQPDVLMSIKSIDDPGRLADTIVAHLAIKHPDKQSMLEMDLAKSRLEKLYELMQGEIEILQVERKIRNRVKKQMERTEKEYYLNEQMRAIQKELGEGEDGRDEVQELEERIAKTKLSNEAREKSLAELKKLKTMSPMSAEATVVRNYLDWMLSIPWKKPSKVKRDIVAAESVLNHDN